VCYYFCRRLAGGNEPIPEPSTAIKHSYGQHNERGGLSPTLSAWRTVETIRSSGLRQLIDNVMQPVWAQGGVRKTHCVLSRLPPFLIFNRRGKKETIVHDVT
jgi:hypothetical protein